jgi:hypothetical protein
MFTWDDLGADQNHREIDIDITHWGDPVSKNAQYGIQPYYVPTNVTRFIAPSGILTHSFRWEPGRVAFRTIRGRPVSGAVTGNGSRRVAEHVFTSGVPSPGGELLALAATSFLLPIGRAQKSSAAFSPTIPKTWDDAAIAVLEVPLADARYSPKHVSAEYYYRVPVLPKPFQGASSAVGEPACFFLSRCLT